jgi:carbon storage regulator
MLVLSRRRDERIFIGDDIEIVIVDIRGEKVRVGINAPRDIAVHRAELRTKADATIEPKSAAAAAALSNASAVAHGSRGNSKAHDVSCTVPKSKAS